jgi:hypothetical protein
MAVYDNYEDMTETLHSLSCAGHIFVEDLTDLEERIQFLQQAYQSFKEGFRDVSTPSSSSMKEPKDVAEISVLFGYLLSKTRITRRWITNYKNRTKIRIDLVSNEPP